MRSLVDLIPRSTPPTAESPVELTRPPIPGFGSWFNRASMRRNLEVMGEVGTLWGIIDTRATTLSGVEWTLYRKPTTTRRAAAGEDRIKVEAHAAIDVWEQPTSWHDQEEWIRLWSMYRDLAGESYVVPATLNGRPDGQPIELWPVRPDMMTPIPHPQKYIAGWIHRSPQGTDTPLDPAQVKQWRLPHPVDPHRGLGPVQALLVDIESMHAGAQWNLNFFLNSALPGGIVEAPEEVSDRDYERFRKRWAERHEGVSNAHRVALLEGATWKDRSMSMRDMEFTKLREISGDVLREAFGMSKTMQGMNEHDNRASAATARHTYGLARDIPRLNELRRWLNRWYLPRFGVAARNLEFDYDRDAVLPEDSDAAIADRDSRVSAAAQLIAAGADPASALEAYGLPPVDFAPTTDAGPDALADVERVAKVIQQVYLGTPDGYVVSVDEARELLRKMGFELKAEAPA